MENTQYPGHGKEYHCLEFGYDQPGDLYLIACGKEECSPFIINGPEVRVAYHLHVILSGKGVLFAGGKEFHPHFGQMFLLKHNEEVTYYPDEKDPWHYCWITFNGRLAQSFTHDIGFTDGIYVLNSSIPPEQFYEIVYRVHERPELNYFNEVRRTGLMLEFLALAMEGTSTIEKIREKRNQKPIESYIDIALEFIHYNYATIKVNDINDYIGFTRSYFTTVFKKFVGISPQKYLMQYRLKKACDQLENTYESIQEIAASVGYENAMTFSRMFKNSFGISPSEYREQHNTEIKGDIE